jgi:hypothetical protein
MKKSYNSPELSVHGSIEMLTAKTFGKDDGVVLTIPGVPGNIPIGS